MSSPVYVWEALVLNLCHNKFCMILQSFWGIFKVDAKMQLVASLCLPLCMEQCDSHQMIHMKFRNWYFH